MRFILLILLSAAAWGQTLITIVDTLHNADNSLFTGRLAIGNPLMRCGVATVPAQTRAIAITAGALSTQLYATADCDDGLGRPVSYSLRYTATDGTSRVAYLAIPVTPTTTTLSAVQTYYTPASIIPLSQIGFGSVADGQVPMRSGASWIGSSGGSGGGSGTVTSVGLSLPAELTVSGTPITAAGTLAGSWASQLQARVFAAPSGSAGTPAFRALVAGDIPALTYQAPLGYTPANVASNLSDLANAATARTNLGLGTAATQATAAFQAAGSYEAPLTFSAPLSRATNTISLPVWGSGTRPVAASALGTTGNCVQWTAAGLGDTGSACGTGGGGASALGYYIVSQATNAPANAVNLGLLSTGLLKISVTGAVATMSAAVAGTDYQAPGSYEVTTAKAAASGYASLDGTTKVPIAQLPTGATASTVAIGNDARLSDSRAPTAHASSHLSSGGDAMAAATTTVRGTVTTTTAISQVASTDDSRLTNARSPTSHASTHQNGGADEIATATAAANAIPKAGAGGTLAVGWIPALSYQAAGTYSGTGACTAGQYATAVTTGVPTCAQVAYSQVSGTPTNAPRTCTIIIGADNGTALADADIAPQKHQCYIPVAATITEIRVTGDAGTPSVLLQRRRGASTVADLLSGALATAAAGAVACAKSSTSTACYDGTTSSATITLANTALSAGDEIEPKTATAGGTAKSMQIHIVWSAN